MKLLKMVGRWKLGVAALAALGLSVLPASFNVPGVGTVEAYANNLTDLSGATVTVTASDFTNAEIDPASLTIALIEKGEDSVAEEDLKKLELTCLETIKDAGKYELGLDYKNSIEKGNLTSITGYEPIYVTINPKDISATDLAFADSSDSYAFTGKEITPAFSFTNTMNGTAGNKLVEGTDYTYTIQLQGRD